MKLQSKIVSGFVILALMLFVAGVFSIIELKSMGYTAKQMLEENYKSIHATKGMLEALEREDSGVLLFILGHRKKGRQRLAAADSQFVSDLQRVEKNITIDRERIFIDSIKAEYSNLKDLWSSLISGSQKRGDWEWYFQNIFGNFTSLKHFIQMISEINENCMYNTASSLNSKANRAIMPGIIAVISSIIFIFIFNYFIFLYVVNPLKRVTKAVSNFNRNKEFKVEIETKDEINDLVNEIRSLFKNHLKI